MAARTWLLVLLACLFLQALAPPVAANAPTPAWRMMCVECPRQADWPSDRVAVDASGRPHFAYGGDHLYYGWYDGTRFHTEVADAASGVGSRAQIALDGRGQPHAIYSDHTGFETRYARRINGLWQSDLVSSSYVMKIVLAVSHDGVAHIVYSTADGQNDLLHARWRGVDAWL